MNPKHISDALQLLDDTLLEETDEIRGSQKPRKKKWRKWAAMAAGLCAVVVGAVILSYTASSRPDNLPLLEIPEHVEGYMGFEGLLYYDIWEMRNGNPWNADWKLSALPVYRNGFYNDEGVAVGLDHDTMMSRIRNVAKTLGAEILDVKSEWTYYLEEQPEPTTLMLTATVDGAEIEMLADGTVTVRFERGENGGLELPAKYQFTYTGTTEKDAAETLDYLIKRFSSLLAFRRPQKVIWGQYDVYNVYHLDYHVYDTTGDKVSDMLNYTFRYADIAPNGKGKLMLIRLYDGLACAEKLGDYPIITADQARKLLLDGRYITSVPYEMPGEEYIGKVELVYRNNMRDKTLIPYYRFYVELPEHSLLLDKGLKDYGAYYVPAIQEKYIANMPIYDGYFN